MAVQRLGSEIKRVSFDLDGEDDPVLVSRVEGKRLVVLSLLFVPLEAIVVRFLSGRNKAITGAVALGAKEPLVLPYSPEGWIETLTGKALTLELGVSQGAAGCLSYVEV